MNRGLTTEEAERGVRPPILTAEEWQLMWLTSLDAEQDAKLRSAHARLRLHEERRHA